MRRKFLTLGIALGAAVPAQAQVITFIVPQAAAACDEVAKDTKIKTREKDLKGPFLILWRDSTQTPWTLGKVSPDYIRQLDYEKKDSTNFNPRQAAQVRMVACATRGAKVKVGEYTITGKTETQPAFGFELDIRVIEWPSRKPVGQWAHRSQPAPFKKERDSNVANVDPSDVAMVLSRMH